MRTIFLVLVFTVACGSVTTSELTTDASGGAGGQLGGRGGMAGDPDGGGDAGDRGGAGGDDAGGAGGQLGGRGGDAGGAGGSAGGAACLDYASGSVPGFAFNAGCNGEPPSDPKACHARCELHGAHFVGCVVNSPIASHCFASCSDCP